MTINRIHHTIDVKWLQLIPLILYSTTTSTRSRNWRPRKHCSNNQKRQHTIEFQSNPTKFRSFFLFLPLIWRYSIRRFWRLKEIWTIFECKITIIYQFAHCRNSTAMTNMYELKTMWSRKEHGRERMKGTQPKRLFNCSISLNEFLKFSHTIHKLYEMIIHSAKVNRYRNCWRQFVHSFVFSSSVINTRVYRIRIPFYLWSDA